MRTIDYRTYLDKVYGCWIGKCVGGTIGAPYEGAKELFDFTYDPSIIENMLPNDDLDLQVLSLAVLEEKGVRFTSDDLAGAFFTRCPYAPGEYAIFKQNYARGLRPPVTGWFNNRYYIEGMGCPIRAEIWGCIAPGNPELAAECAAKDGIMDHRGNSVYAEQFLAGLEAAAFFESDLDKLIEIGLGLIPEDSKVAGLIRDVRDWCKSSSDWRYVRGQVIRKYGHPDCTNMFQNIGITLLALYLGKMDFIETNMIALNCGFDTDCTCGIAAAILGLIQGGEYLSTKYGFGDPGFKLEVDAPRRSDRVWDLAEDTCLMGLHFAECLNKEVSIINAPPAPNIELPEPEPVAISVEYHGNPAIGIGDTRRVTVLFKNTSGETFSGTAEVSIPKGWKVEAPAGKKVLLPPHHVVYWNLHVTVPDGISVLQEANICEVTLSLEGREPMIHRFGIVGAAVWQVFGPFWQNNVEMPPLKLKESFYSHIPGGSKDIYADNVRLYHLNTRVDPDREYMTLEEILSGGVKGDASKQPALFNAYEDKFSVNDVVGFQGPCAVYMVRRLISPEDRTVGLHIGHTDAYKLWINGNLVSERENTDWWTAENAHIHDFKLKKGLNTIVVKLCRRGENVVFSLIFAKGGPCTAHWPDFASENTKARC